MDFWTYESITNIFRFWYFSKMRLNSNYLGFRQKRLIAFRALYYFINVDICPGETITTSTAPIFGCNSDIGMHCFLYYFFSSIFESNLNFKIIDVIPTMKMNKWIWIESHNEWIIRNKQSILKISISTNSVDIIK